MAKQSWTIQEQVAWRVKEKRKRLRITQSELAEKVGTSQTAIARLENARGNPSVEFIQRVVTALDMQMTIFVKPPMDAPGDLGPEWLARGSN